MPDDIHEVIDLSAGGLDALENSEEPSNIIPKDYWFDSVRIDARLGDIQEIETDVVNESDSDEGSNDEVVLDKDADPEAYSVPGRRRITRSMASK